MKKIFAGRQIGILPGENMNWDRVKDLHNDAETNRLAVIAAALAIETMMEKIIVHFFYPPGHEKREPFEQLILASDWCSFSAKRKLMQHIIDSGNILEGKAKDDFNKKLSDVMTYRNAFAHGKFTTDGKGVTLSYFKGSTIKQELTDDYLAKVEGDLQATRDLCYAVGEKFGAIVAR